MKRELRDQWVKALRSGEYAQTQGVLQDNDGYCCLGVLCEVYEKAGHAKAARSTYEAYRLKGMFLTNQPVGRELPEGITDDLISLNDSQKLPFPAIADWIETNIPAED